MKDDEVYGSGNFYDYGFRMYMPQIARFLTVDPLTKDYPELTPYQFASNSPISGIDLDGLEYYYAGDGTLIAKWGESTQVRLLSDKFVAENSGAKKFAVRDLDANSTDVGMTNEELNVRAFMSTLKQTENHGGSALPYNAKHGFSNGKLATFTDKSYDEAPEDYKSHPYEGKKGGTAAGAYQILKPTFKGYQKLDPDNVKDFGPRSQDNVVMGILKYSKALNDIKAGNLDNAVKKLTNSKIGVQFASLPGGGQEGGMTMDKVNTLFKGNVSRELNGKSDIATPKGELK